ncbi:Secreted protein OS=Streptomyces rimosus subsp. rimosus (strain ATCC / DSM 40260 / JCM 4667 / NRRL 2234) OX=1265868 GN=SRIM_002670 PE=4 SV=1 [Streptomyces rimosus subsp. rimosus]
MPGDRSKGVITPIGHQGFRLGYDGSALGRVNALERRYRALRPVSLTSWLNTRAYSAPHLSRCPTRRCPLADADGFCWQRGSSDDLGWAYVPQGLTGSGEAEPRSGLWRGAASSPRAGRPATATRAPRAARTTAPRGAKQVDHFMKVSFTDVTDRGRARYRSALLVAPQRNGFAALKGHGDTLSWYGPHLFLYSNERLRVFDVRHLWATTASSPGVHRGAVSASWQQAALPQVAEYSFIGRRGCGSGSGETPCFSGASIDHGSALSPSLVTVETSRPTSRVVRWPLSPTSHLLRRLDSRGLVRATAGYRVPLAGPQGVVQLEDQFYFSAMCPDARRRFGEPYCLYRGSNNGPVRVWSRTPAAAENLFLLARHRAALGLQRVPVPQVRTPAPRAERVCRRQRVPGGLMHDRAIRPGRAP